MFPKISIYNGYDLSIFHLLRVLGILALQGLPDVCHEAVLVLHDDLLTPDGIGDPSSLSLHRPVTAPTV